MPVSLLNLSPPYSIRMSCFPTSECTAACSGDINVDTVMHAAAYCTYLESHARRIYGMVGAANVNAAQTLCQHLAEGDFASGFTARDVRRKKWSGLTTPEQVKGALQQLEEHGYVRTVRKGDVGRPTISYTINPALLRQAQESGHD